ncbi:right-handed parallel beta-helix repeat-containing protein, partial [Candidatus Woesearchaeota archaeon]|nr:right-handed parallel beta-helix repeat-containing protein [Candidatus Woesearchaeota archaeon]
QGLEFNGTVLVFKNNEIVGVKSVRFYKPVVIEGNDFSGFKHEALALMPGSDGSIIRNNEFHDAWRLNREIIGVRLYPGVSDVEIYNNSFRMLPIAFLMANIPPWGYCRDITLHDNVVTKTFTAFHGKIEDSIIYNEDYEDNFAGALILEASRNILVENSSFKKPFFTELYELFTKQYYEQVKDLFLDPPMAYWAGPYVIKSLVLLRCKGDHIVFRNNYFGKTPPRSLGLVLDTALGITDLEIVNNTFEDIGTFIPEGFVQKELPPSCVEGSYTTGAAICLENSDNVLIENNTFKNVLSAVSSVKDGFSDALGNFGSVIIKNNKILGRKTFSWIEQKFNTHLDWWASSTQIQKYATTAFEVGSTHLEDMTVPERPVLHNAALKNSGVLITDNFVENFTTGFRIVMKYLPEDSENLGFKIVVVKQNQFLNVDENEISVDNYKKFNVLITNQEFVNGKQCLKYWTNEVLNPWLGIDKAGSRLLILNSKFQTCGNALSCHNCGQILVFNTEFLNNKQGLEFIKTKNHKVRASKFENNKIAVLLKNVENALFFSNILKNNEYGLVIDKTKKTGFNYLTLIDNDIPISLDLDSYPGLQNDFSNTIIDESGRVTIIQNVHNANSQVYDFSREKNPLLLVKESSNLEIKGFNSSNKPCIVLFNSENINLTSINCKELIVIKKSDEQHTKFENNTVRFKIFDSDISQLEINGLDGEAVNTSVHLQKINISPGNTVWFKYPVRFKVTDGSRPIQDAIVKIQTEHTEMYSLITNQEGVTRQVLLEGFKALGLQTSQGVITEIQPKQYTVQVFINGELVKTLNKTFMKPETLEIIVQLTPA